MPNASVSPHQFALDGDQVVHAPTGAWWKASPNTSTLSSIGMEKLGAPLSNGDEYDIRKVEEIALTILRERLLAKRF